MTDYDEIVDEFYLCTAMDELLSMRQACDDLPCDLHVEELDDNQTKE